MIILQRFTHLTKNTFITKDFILPLYVTQHVRQFANQEQQAQNRQQKPACSSIQKSLHVAVIGVPNAGKSTFINNLINHRVCPISNKVHTTRAANTAISTTKNTQLVFYDTPGLVTQKEIKRHNLTQSFKSAYRHAIQHADYIAVLQDVSNSWTRNELHSTVVDTLKEYAHMPSVLILNKVDALKSKRILLDLIRKLSNDSLCCTDKTYQRIMKKQARLKEAKLKEEEQQWAEETKKVQSPEQKPLLEVQTSWGDFENIFLVSSITADGLEAVHDYFISKAIERPWKFESTEYTDLKPEELIVESVRARLLDYLPQEIPYILDSQLEYYSEEDDTIYVSVQIICPTARIERLVCGVSDGRLRQITERITSDLVETFGKRISLTITTSNRQEKQEKQAT